MNIPSSRVERFGKQLFRQFVQNFQKNSCAGVTFWYTCRLKNCNFIWKGVWHRCFPVYFAKIFKMATQHLCAAASAISAILIKTLRIALWYYVCSARMAVELKFGCPKSKWIEKIAWIKRIRSEKVFIRNFFLFFMIPWILRCRLLLFKYSNSWVYKFVINSYWCYL